VLACALAAMKQDLPRQVVTLPEWLK